MDARIYRGEDGIVRHWLKAPWNMDGWRLDVVHMLGEAGGARHNLPGVAGITRAAKRRNLKALYCGGTFRRCAAVATGRAEDAAMNYLAFTFRCEFLIILTVNTNRSISMPDLYRVDG